jgi:hypothetical protein
LRSLRLNQAVAVTRFHALMPWKDSTPIPPLPHGSESPVQSC